MNNDILENVMANRLRIVPINLRTANAYVSEYHRHNKHVTGQKFSIGVKKGDKLVGVCICGNPIARMLDDGETIEARRVCTDGTPNACSILYGAAARIAKEMGYKRIITYLLQSEPGTSLKASGWVCTGDCGGKSWDSPGRRREINNISLFGSETKYSLEPKTRWERVFRKHE